MRVGLKRTKIMPFAATWMDLQIIILSEVSQKEKDKYHVISVMCRVLKIIQINLFTKQIQTHRHRKHSYGYQWGKGEQGGIN